MLREIRIKPVLNGWIVKVGCQTVVFRFLPKMLEEIEKYLANPDETEKEYQESAVNAKHTFGVVCNEERGPNRNLIIGNPVAITAT